MKTQTLDQTKNLARITISLMSSDSHPEVSLVRRFGGMELEMEVEESQRFSHNMSTSA